MKKSKARSGHGSHGTLIRGVVYKELEVLSCVFLETATFSSIKILGEIM